MNNDLLKAILAMDSYHRGYDAGITLSDVPSTQIGTATILATSSVSLEEGADQEASFYAIAYTLGSGETIISLCTPSAQVGQIDVNC